VLKYYREVYMKVIFFLFFLIPVFVFSQIMSDYQIIPVVAHSEGGGVPPTYWRSDLTLYNPNETDLKIGFSFWEENIPNSIDFSKTIVLKKKETIIVEDVLNYLFGINQNKKGALIISSKKEFFPENPEDSKFLCISRTYNTGDPKGTYGQTVLPGNLFLNGFATPIFLTGLRQDERFRTNIGFLNLSKNSIKIYYKFIDSKNNLLKDGYQNMPPYSLKQISVSSIGIQNVLGSFSGEFWMDPSLVSPDPCSEPDFNSFIIYASKVDGNPEGTGDAEFIYGIPKDFPPAGFNCNNEEPVTTTCSANPTSGFAPLTVQFTSTPRGGKGNYYFRWDFGDGTFSDKQNPSHTYTTVGTYKPYVIVTDGYTSAYCEQTINVYSANTPPTIDNLQANPNPVPTNSQSIVSFTLNDKNTNDLITWEATLTNGGGGTLSSYSGGPVPPGTNVQITFFSVNPTQAKLTVKAIDKSNGSDEETLYIEVQ
jgi:PKD repeat protein